jgi:hypothetical protein
VEVIDMVKVKVGPFEFEFNGALGACCFMIAAFCIYAARVQGAL